MSFDDLTDPACDPTNPRTVNFEQISAAAYRIRDGVVRTPCDLSHMSEETGMQIYLKKDYMQYTGSFKERGARYTLLRLSPEERKKGVISASAGNHALAMAYHGGILGIPITVVMPNFAPMMKIENCKKYGATVKIQGQNMGECKDHALAISKASGMIYINGYDHINILAGQGTMGLEILEQIPDVDAVVIPVGGGGLLAGCAVALKTMKPDIQIIGVEPDLCPSFSMALKAGKPVYTKTETTLADGLAVPCVGINAFQTAAPLIDKMVTVSEEWIAISILRLIEMEKAVVEGGGAAGIAAVLAGLLPELKGKKVVIPLCGGNIDTTILGRCLDRGLAADGRLVKFTVTVSDRPGGIAELAKLLTTCQVSIKDIVHERAWIKNDIFSVEVKVLAETRNRHHSRQMFKTLRGKYSLVRIEGMDEDFDLQQTEDGGTNFYLNTSSLSEPEDLNIHGTFSAIVNEDESWREELLNDEAKKSLDKAKYSSDEGKDMEMKSDNGIVSSSKPYPNNENPKIDKKNISLPQIVVIDDNEDNDEDDGSDDEEHGQGEWKMEGNKKVQLVTKKIRKHKQKL